MTVSAVSAKELANRLEDARKLLELFALVEQYKAKFLNDPMLSFFDIDSGEFRGSLHDFCFFRLEEAIAKFHHILNTAKQKEVFQKPEPFSYEKHIQIPAKLHDRWSFCQDLDALMRLNRRRVTALKTSEVQKLALKLLWEYDILSLENHCDSEFASGKLTVTFDCVADAQNFITNLNRFVMRWVTVESLDQLLEMLCITRPATRNSDTEAILLDLDWEHDSNGVLATLTEDIKTVAAVEGWLFLFENGIKLVGDDASHDLVYPFDMREFSWRVVLATLTEDIKTVAAVEGWLFLFENGIKLVGDDASHDLVYPFDMREFWWRVRQLAVIYDDTELATHLGLEHDSFEGNWTLEEDTDRLIEAIQERIDPRLHTQIVITGRQLAVSIFHFLWRTLRRRSAL